MSSSDARAAARRFLRIFAGAIAAVAAILLLLTWFVDPSGLLRHSGLSSGVCAPGTHSSDERYAKPLLATVHRPMEVVVGTSRAIHGFSSNAFVGRDAVNLALSGATFAEIDALARHAANGEAIERIWVGLDFSHFVGEQTPREPLVIPPPGQDSAWIAVRYGMLDQRAIRSALRAVVSVDACRMPPYSERGFSAHPLTYAEAREQRDRIGLASAIRGWRAARQGRTQLYDERMLQLERLLAHLRERRVQVIVYLGPTSTEYRDAVTAAALDNYFARWPRDVHRLVMIHRGIFVAADREEFLAPVRRQVCGPSPEADCLFVDATHFRPEVGDQIVRSGLAIDAR